MKDFYLQQAKAGVKLRFPDQATPDALAAIGDERLIDQGNDPLTGTTETQAAYAARVKGAWGQDNNTGGLWYWGGTAFGMLTALAAQGYTGIHLIQQNGIDWTLPAGVITATARTPWSFATSNWNQFILVMPTAPASWTGMVTPPTPTSVPSQDEVQKLFRIIDLWRPVHMLCAGILVIVSGNVWGYPDGKVWGSHNWGPGVTVFYPFVQPSVA